MLRKFLIILLSFSSLRIGAFPPVGLPVRSPVTQEWHLLPPRALVCYVESRVGRGRV